MSTGELKTSPVGNKEEPYKKHKEEYNKYIFSKEKLNSLKGEFLKKSAMATPAEKAKDSLDAAAQKRSDRRKQPRY